MTDSGKVILKKTPLFSLINQNGKEFDLEKALSEDHIMLVFFPGGMFKPTCTKQFCDYRDNYERFKRFGIKIVGISTDPVNKLYNFSHRNDYPFEFLSDINKVAAKKFRLSTIFLTNRIKRANFIINKKGIILYQFIESSLLERRETDHLMLVLEDLKTNSLI